MEVSVSLFRADADCNPVAYGYACCFVFYLDARFSDAESNSGLTKATTDTLEAYLDVNEDGSWEVDNFLKKSVDKQHGWMQIIDSKGKTAYSYSVPKDVPGTYTKKELLSIYKTKSFITIS